MFRRKFIQNISSLSLIPFIPVPKKEYWEYFEIIRTTTNDIYVILEENNNILFSISLYEDEKSTLYMFEHFKKCDINQELKYIYVLNYQNYYWYVASSGKLNNV